MKELADKRRERESIAELYVQWLKLRQSMVYSKNYISDCMYGTECRRVGVIRDEHGGDIKEL